MGGCSDQIKAGSFAAKFVGQYVNDYNTLEWKTLLERSSLLKMQIQIFLLIDQYGLYTTVGHC